MESIQGAADTRTGALVASDVLVVLGVIAVVVLILGIGVALGIQSRRRKSRHHSRHHGHSSAAPTGQIENLAETSGDATSESSSADEGNGAASRRRRGRRRRRDHRPRNPTLAEAGGLPPTRPEDAQPDEHSDG